MDSKQRGASGFVLYYIFAPSKGLRNSQEYSVFIRNVNPRYQKFDSKTYFIEHKDYINN